MPSREPELYKDKIEVSLDGRQIFYLFFGGAVIVGLVFVLGVMVGRRVEARGHLDRAETQAARDPLAALDRLEHADNLQFHGALTGAEQTTDVEKAIGELDKKRGGKPAEAAKLAEPKAEAVKAEAKPEKREAEKRDDKAEKRDDERREAKRDDKTEKKADEAKKGERADEAKKSEKSEKSEKRDEDKHAKKHDDEKSDKHEKSEKSEKSDKAEKSEKRAERDDKSEKKFTLQLSSFQDKSEAEAFLASVKSAGFSPYLTEADVSGKGTFYRVRLGSYRSMDAATDAKAEFEKASKKTAQIMRL